MREGTFHGEFDSDNRIDQIICQKMTKKCTIICGSTLLPTPTPASK